VAARHVEHAGALLEAEVVGVLTREQTRYVANGVGECDARKAVVVHKILAHGVFTGARPVAEADD